MRFRTHLLVLLFSNHRLVMMSSNCLGDDVRQSSSGDGVQQKFVPKSTSQQTETEASCVAVPDAKLTNAEAHAIAWRA